MEGTKLPSTTTNCCMTKFVYFHYHRNFELPLGPQLSREQIRRLSPNITSERGLRCCLNIASDGTGVTCGGRLFQKVATKLLNFVACVTWALVVICLQMIVFVVW